MKIDVEVAEIEVLRGARDTIRVHLPAIVVEVHWLGDAFLDYLAEELEPLGYRALTLAGQPLPRGFSRYHAVLTVL
jgi:hypothetical protein